MQTGAIRLQRGKKMLKIITNIDLIQDKKMMTLPYKMFNSVLKLEGGISERISDIIYKIDNCKLTENGMVISKFTHVPIEITHISDGAKTVAYVMECCKMGYVEEIINITSCGPNAIKYILENFSNYNLTLYLGHFDIPENISCNIEFNHKKISNTSEAFC